MVQDTGANPKPVHDTVMHAHRYRSGSVSPALPSAMVPGERMMRRMPSLALIRLARQ